MSQWEKISDNRIGGTGSKSEQNKKNKIYNKMIKSCKSKDLEDLKKEGDKAYEDMKARENSLVDAYVQKKLKSKALIKEAKRIVLERERKTKAKKKITNEG